MKTIENILGLDDLSKENWAHYESSLLKTIIIDQIKISGVVNLSDEEFEELEMQLLKKSLINHLLPQYDSMPWVVALIGHEPRIQREIKKLRATLLDELYEKWKSQGCRIEYS